MEKKTFTNLNHSKINYNADKVETNLSTAKVLSFADFKIILPRVCSHIYEILGSQQLEATYQRALTFELEAMDIKVFQEESIPILYKGRLIGSRRADLVLELVSGEKIILELKAVMQLTSENLKQLHYYMSYFDISNGYLINFPHLTGFPDSEFDDVFECTNVLGASSLSDRVLKKQVSKTPEIVKVSMIQRAESNRSTNTGAVNSPKQSPKNVEGTSNDTSILTSSTSSTTKMISQTRFALGASDGTEEHSSSFQSIRLDS